MSKEFPKKRDNKGKGKKQHSNYASSNRNNNDAYSEQLFVMRPMVNVMTNDVHASEDVWYVDFGASNHMTSCGEWFKNMKELNAPGYVETGDDTTHPTAYIGKVPLNMQDGKVKYLADMLHVPRPSNIIKNLVSVGQMIE